MTGKPYIWTSWDEGNHNQMTLQWYWRNLSNYSSLIEKLEHTEVIRWFPNHQVQESWITEI